MLVRVDEDIEVALKKVAAMRVLAMVDFAKLVLPSEEEVRLVLLAPEATAAERVAAISQERRPYVLRALAWLMKLGVLR
jgi:hypothetical protein